jgi:hypothetical protein
MSDEQDAADALAHVVGVGSPPQEADLAAAVSRHVAAREVSRAPADPATVAALRALAADPSPVLGGKSDDPVVMCSPLSIMVDFNELLDRYGDPYVWTILGKLKDLFGASQ